MTTLIDCVIMASAIFIGGHSAMASIQRRREKKADDAPPPHVKIGDAVDVRLDSGVNLWTSGVVNGFATKEYENGLKKMIVYKVTLGDASEWLVHGDNLKVKEQNVSKSEKSSTYRD